MVANRKILMNEEQMTLAFKQLAIEMKRRHGSFTGVVLVGIKRRGDSLAKKLAAHIKEMFDSYIVIGSIKVELYKEDLSKKYKEPRIKSLELDLDRVQIKNAIIIVVDDVVWSGRTAFRVTNVLLKKGAQVVEICALIDRVGHRMRPLLVQYRGLEVRTQRGEQVKVQCIEDDGADLVTLIKIKESIT